MYCLAADGRDGVTGRRMTAVAQAARAKLPMSVEPRVLVLNAGSLSVKFALYSTDLLPTLHLSGAVEGIGHSGGRFHTMDWTAHAAAEETRPVSSLEDAIELVLTFMERRATGVIVGVGHRVVHGGPGCDGPKYVTPELEERLREIDSACTIAHAEQCGRHCGRSRATARAAAGCLLRYRISRNLARARETHGLTPRHRWRGHSSVRFPGTLLRIRSRRDPA